MSSVCKVSVLDGRESGHPIQVRVCETPEQLRSCLKLANTSLAGNDYYYITEMYCVTDDDYILPTTEKANSYE